MLALVAGSAFQTLAAIPGASQVLNYQSGILPSNLKGFTNTQAVLGTPSAVTEGPFGGPVDPFNPPYLTSQLISIGQGGNLTVQLEPPARNDASHPFGLDFIIHGNAGFTITNGDYAGGGVTDGSLFGQAKKGSIRIWVSPDNVVFYELKSDQLPEADSYFPTDGAGLAGQPVDPKLTKNSFAGLNLAGIRSEYAGSAGGAGYDLDWAVDAQGKPASLPSIQFVRLEVVSGDIDVDAFAVVPSPSVRTVELRQTFSGDPGVDGWKWRGDPRCSYGMPHNSIWKQPGTHPNPIVSFTTDYPAA